MATTEPPARPLSPHLSIWKWGPHMAASIFHRVTGTGMATLGTVLLVWWLAAAAGGEESYAAFLDLLTVKAGGLNIVGYVLLIGLSWAFFQHLANGVRHLIQDIGANYELGPTKTASTLTFVFAIIATIALWGWILRAPLGLVGSN